MFPSDYKERKINEIKELQGNGEEDLFYYVPEALGLMASGGDITDADGINVIEKICDFDLENSLEDLSNALLLLDTKKYKAPENAKWNREKIIDKILELQCEEGGWKYSEEDSNPDLEITANIITSLAPYNDDKYPKVKEAIKKSVDYLSKVQNAKGGYNSDCWPSVVCAEVITGLCANGIDPTSEEFTKNDINLIDKLLSYQFKQKDFALSEYGGFCDDKVSLEEMNCIATEKAVTALVQYIYFLEGKGSIFSFVGESTSPDEPHEKDTTAPTIKVEKITNGQVVNKEELKFKVSANDNVDGKVDVTVKLNDEIVKENNGEYTVTLKEGENSIKIEAIDKAGNKAEKTYKVTYKKLPKITLDKTLVDLKVGQSVSLKATIESKDVSNDDLIWSSNDEEVASVDKNGKVTAKKQGTAKITVNIKNGDEDEKDKNKAQCLVVVASNKGLTERVNQAIQKVQDFVIKNNTWSSDWKTVAFSKSGIEIPKDYNKNYLDGRNKLLIESKGHFYKVTDYERITLGVVAAGGDPRNVGGYNLLDKIYNFYDPQKPQRKLDFQGLNGVIYGLIALDTKNYEVPKNAKYSREYMLDYVLNHRNSDGGWDLCMNGSNSDVDITSMTLIALAPYHDYVSKSGKKVKDAVEEAVNWLSKVQRKDGGFNSWFTQNNSESCAQTIIGLCANGINPTCEKFTKDRNLVENLLRFQQSNGEFYHLMDGSQGVNGMSTEQAFQALDAYKIFLDMGSKYCNGKNSIYYFGKDENVKPSEKKDFIVTRIGEGKLKKNSDANVKFSIKNNLKEDKEVTFAVVLYDKDTNEMLNYSYIKKNIKAGENDEFAGGFSIPPKGNYKVKAIVCDDLDPDKMNILSNVVEIEVE
ncbi:prenyltransferase/squalene oxidase repeat-containing protein [Haloimpatiens sp. FM7330]|uniref:Ig-like domain-containing protein n=1 Tax=Haloimpatiens sp. FM7330 TaxID=3298610 RepID=UPI00362A4454